MGEDPSHGDRRPKRKSARDFHRPVRSEGVAALDGHTGEVRVAGAQAGNLELRPDAHRAQLQFQERSSPRSIARRGSMNFLVENAHRSELDVPPGRGIGSIDRRRGLRIRHVRRAHRAERGGENRASRNASAHQPGRLFWAWYNGGFPSGSAPGFYALKSTDSRELMICRGSELARNYEGIWPGERQGGANPADLLVRQPSGTGRARPRAL